MNRIQSGTWVVLLGLICNLCAAQDYSSWVGKKAVERDNTTFTLKIGNQVVASGDHCRLYTIERANGAWLWLVAGGVKGWAPASEVLLLDDAPRYFTEYIRTHPDDLRWGYVSRGAAWQYKGDYDLAIADFGEAIRQDPSENSAYCLRATCFLDKHDYDRAISDLNDALRINPSDATAYRDRGHAHRYKKEYDEALADYNQSLRLDPDDSYTFYNRGLTYAEMNDLEKAIADFTTAMGVEPGNALFVYHRGWTYHRLGQNDKALKDLDEAVRLDPKWPGYLVDRGVVLAEGLHDLDRAMADYNKAITLDPKRESAYRNRGYAHRLKEELDQAIADYSKAIELDPKNAWTYKLRADVYKLKHEFERAIADCDEALKVDPKSAATYETRGLSKFLKGDHEASAPDFARMFEFGAPKEAHPMYGAILEFEALRLAGKPDQAKKHIDAVVSRLDSSKWPFPIVRYLRGEIDEAALIAVATDNDKQTEVHCYLGYQDLINGDKVKAQEHFRWVAEHGPKTFIETELARAELERMGG